jgi:hypothetical protein
MAAIGCSGYALKRKWFNDPQINVSKARRSGGTAVAYEDCDDAPPFWASAKYGSISIFGPGANPILENKLKLAEVATVGGTYTVQLPADGGDEEEEEGDAAEDLQVIASADDLEPDASEGEE